jgi:hypothetical protein
LGSIADTCKQTVRTVKNRKNGRASRREAILRRQKGAIDKEGVADFDARLDMALPAL